MLSGNVSETYEALMSNPIIEVVNVTKEFNAQDPVQVLQRCHFKVYPGEIVALLGKSGSGKSTLLRIMAGLIEPNQGHVTYHNHRVNGPVQGLSMVFQDFALLPWLTVLGNVELGLEALGIRSEERRNRALHAIDVVGMDGFESAYPKELSGGMRQRVGLARALAVNPSILLMDEPFSALDVLTAENLRSDLLTLWQQEKTNLQCIFLVTHNIEEAAELADRILIFSSNPGHVKSTILVNLPHPRSCQDQGFKDLVDQIYNCLAAPDHRTTHSRQKPIDSYYRLPTITIAEMSGLLQLLNGPEFEKKADLSEFAEELQLDVDELFKIIEVVGIIDFAHVQDGDISLTDEGRMFADADVLEQKKIFARQLLLHIPLIKQVKKTLTEHPEHRLSEQVFLRELEHGLSEEAAKEVLTVAIDWGRYAELFAYHVNSGMLSLEDPG